MPDPNTCGNEYAALTGSPYAPRFKEQSYVTQINELLARVAELEAERKKIRGALQDIADENTGIEPALFAYAVLNPD